MQTFFDNSLETKLEEIRSTYYKQLIIEGRLINFLEASAYAIEIEKNKNIRSLVFKNCVFESGKKDSLSMEIIVDLARRNQFESFALCYTQTGSKGFEEIRRLLRISKSLKKFIFQGVKFKLEEISGLISELEKNTTLRTLILEHVDLSSAGIQILASFLEKNTSLEELCIEDISLGRCEMDWLISAVNGNKNLKSLSISIGNEAVNKNLNVDFLAKSLQNFKLKKLVIKNYLLTEAESIILAEGLEKNEHLVHFEADIHVNTLSTFKDYLERNKELSADLKRFDKETNELNTYLLWSQINKPLYGFMEFNRLDSKEIKASLNCLSTLASTRDMDLNSDFKIMEVFRLLKALKKIAKKKSQEALTILRVPYQTPYLNSIAEVAVGLASATLKLPSNFEEDLIKLNCLNIINCLKGQLHQPELKNYIYSALYKLTCLEKNNNFDNFPLFKKQMLLLSRQEIVNLIQEIVLETKIEKVNDLHILRDFLINKEYASSQGKTLGNNFYFIRKLKEKYPEAKLMTFPEYCIACSKEPNASYFIQLPEVSVENEYVFFQRSNEPPINANLKRLITRTEEQSNKRPRLG